MIRYSNAFFQRFQEINASPYHYDGTNDYDVISVFIVMVNGMQKYNVPISLNQIVYMTLGCP